MTSIEFDAEGLPVDFDAKTFAEEGIEIPIPKDSLATFSLTSNPQHCRCTSDSDSGCSLDEFSWVPPGLTPALVCFNGLWLSLSSFIFINFKTSSLVCLIYCFYVICLLCHFILHFYSVEINFSNGNTCEVA